MKREAAKIQKQEQQEKKREEAARKKAAQTTTKKTLQLATKITGPLTNAWTAGADVLSKAAPLEDELPEGELPTLMKSVDDIDKWRKECSSALSAYTKNPKCDLEALSFDFETANQTIKDCQSATKSVRKMLADHKKSMKEKANGGA